MYRKRQQEAKSKSSSTHSDKCISKKSSPYAQRERNLSPSLKDHKKANTVHACKTCLWFLAFLHHLLRDIEESYNQVLPRVILLVHSS